jgi:pimeloyl-ACP methyl ester carboxylesterase
MDSVTSKDGTVITYDRLGSGPAVILVTGGSVDRMSNAPLAESLAPHFTVFNYDRRGRNESGDTPPYAVEREVEDIAAMADAAGGSAYLYGSSSGAALALEAACQLGGAVITKLALWEPPYIPDGFPKPPADTAKTYTDLVAQGRRGDAVEFFMGKVVGLPPEFITQMRASPFWAQQEALAHTLAYDATVMGDYTLPVGRVAEVNIPTLVLAGSASMPFMPVTARAIVEHLPNGQQRMLEGQRHDVAAEALAPALIEFFGAE